MVNAPFSAYSRRVAEQIRIIFNLSYNLSAAWRHEVPDTEPVKVESTGIMEAARGPSTPNDSGETDRSTYPSITLYFTLGCSPSKMKAGAMGFIAGKSDTASGSLSNIPANKPPSDSL